MLNKSTSHPQPNKNDSHHHRCNAHAEAGTLQNHQDDCDIEWETKMKSLNPGWQPSRASLTECV